MPSFRSGALSALIVLSGTAFLAGFVASPPAAYGLLWLAAEVRALRHRARDDFSSFELDPFDTARLDSARETAADIVTRLSDIEAGRIREDDPDAVDRLIDRYRGLRTRMAALRELPIRRLRQWSGARATASALRIGLVFIPLLSALLLMRISPDDAPTALKVVAAVTAGWTLLALPPLIWLRRRRIESALGDRELFYERWRPDEDFLDFYLAHAERAEAAQREQPTEDAEPRREEPAPPPEPEPTARPKRPWYEVLKVEPDADEAKIKRAYHLRLMEYHPDRVATLGEEIKSLAETVSKEIVEAYQEAGRSR